MQAARPSLLLRSTGFPLTASSMCRSPLLYPTSYQSRKYRAQGRQEYEKESGGGEKIERTKELKTSLSSHKIQDARKAAKSFLPDFDMAEKVIVITGGGRGLGLTLAEALYQAGAIVHCLDRLDRPYDEFVKVQQETPSELGGALHYHHIDVSATDELRALIAKIAGERSRLDGCITAAGIQQVTPALDYEPRDIVKVMDINYTAVFMTAQAVAREMLKHGTPGSIVLVSSMSAYIANKGLLSPVYNSSKAAVAQLARNLAMEWGKEKIRVNALCPGNILTPMVKKNFEDTPELEEIWKSNNMLHRISNPEEYRGAGIYLLSGASSFVTGSSLMVDGGYTAW